VDRTEIETRTKAIFQALFNRAPATINADSSPDNIEGWDSLQHLNLVSSLESEFGVAFDDEQVVQMLNFGLIVEILQEALPRPA
jgi:acyl carrier protein